MLARHGVWAAFALALAGCGASTQTPGATHDAATGRANDAASGAAALPDGSMLEVVGGQVVTIGPEGSTSAVPLPSCHWPSDLDPPDAGDVGPGKGAFVGWYVNRLFLFCGSCQGGGCNFGGSDSLTTLLGQSASPSPCVLGCGPDQYVFGTQTTDEPGVTILPSPATPAGCTSLFPYAQADVDQTDGPASQGPFYCCPCL